MKRLIYIVTFALAALVGCDKENSKVPSLEQRIQGEWRGSEISVDAAIYIGIMADGTFELYQKMASEGFELRRGTWSLDSDILSGAYNDGEAWAASYKVSAGSTLTLVSQAEGGETNVYIPCAIPEEIKRNCTIVVRSR